MKYSLITLFFIIVFTSGCSLKKYPTYNDSYYTFKVFKKKKSSNKISNIQLEVYDSNKNPLINHPTWIKNGCDKLLLDKGEIRYDFSYDKIPSSPLSFKIDAFGYSSIETRPIELKKNDSIIFKIYLAEPKMPIIDCQ